MNQCPRKVSLEQMRTWSRWLRQLNDEQLHNVVRTQFDGAVCEIVSWWSYYHLARDEQINRIRARHSAVVDWERVVSLRKEHAHGDV